MGKFICLQAGHEGVTTGATGAPGEQELNKRIRAEVARLLIERDFVVQLVNANPSDAQISKDFDLFLSLHGDANIYGTGGGVICAPDPNYDSVNTESRRISAAIESEYFKHSEIVNHPERINVNMTRYYMWSRLSAKTPCVILEMGVVQDAHDKVLLNDTHRIASAIVRGICKAFGVSYDLKPQVDPCEAQNKEISNLKTTIQDLTANGRILEDKLRESEKRVVDLSHDATQWDTTKKAYKVTNFTELDAKIRTIENGDLSKYMLITKHEAIVKPLKESLKVAQDTLVTTETELQTIKKWWLYKRLFGKI